MFDIDGAQNFPHVYKLNQRADSPLTPQHRHLMPQYQDLRVLGGVASRQQRQPAEYPDHEQVDETDQHER